MRASIDIFIRRFFRVWMAFCAVGGGVQLTLNLVLLVQGQGLFYKSVFDLLMGLSFLVYFGWISYVAWRHPVLHFGPDEISWRPPGSLRARRLALSEVTGFRWPLPKDLWIEGAGETTLRIPVIGISALDRERARAWLEARWVDGGFV